MKCAGRREPATSPDRDAALLPGSRKVEGKAVNDADAKHADVAINSVAGTGSGAMEEPAAGGDAAPAEAAARIDAEEEAQSAEDATDTATWETSKGRGMHAHLLLSSDATEGAARSELGKTPGSEGCSGREMVTRYGPFDPVDIDERCVRPRLATLAARRRCALTRHRGVILGKPTGARFRSLSTLYRRRGVPVESVLPIRRLEATPVCAAQSLPDLCPAQFSPRCESCNATGHRYVIKVWKCLVEVSCSCSIESA